MRESPVARGVLGESVLDLHDRAWLPRTGPPVHVQMESVGGIDSESSLVHTAQYAPVVPASVHSRGSDCAAITPPHDTREPTLDGHVKSV
ncbi:MAG: hypothetical protein ACK5IN_09155, partial [Microbacterium sp.]